MHLHRVCTPLYFLFVIGIFALFAPLAAPAPDEGEPAPTLPEAWIKSFNWRSIGPANMGGRITDIAVAKDDPCLWWAATASGGLLKTTNNGMTFEHQFDHENTVSIGDIAVAPSDSNILWVGTGEANPRNSVSWGDGVYKSVDGGDTWKHMGLKESFQIGRIVIHPCDPNIVYVGTLGRLWGPNEMRGLFKTADGGETWEKVLYIDDLTGVIDVAIHPTCPDTLIVATYERQRDGYDSNDPKKKWGPGSGLHKTVDGGKTFTKITEGLPSCQYGRIGLDYYQKNPDIIFAVIESEKVGKEPENAPYTGIRGEDAEVGARLTEITEEGPAEKAGLKTGDIVIAVEEHRVLSYSDFLKAIRQYMADDTVEVEVVRNKESMKMEVTFTKKPGSEEDAEENPGRRRRSSNTFSSGLGGQRENLQDQQGKSGHEFGGIYKSEDGGESWTRINSVNPRPMYFSQIRVDPSDENHLYVLGISLYRSKDGGETFTSDGGRGAHPDHHALWVDPEDGRHIILGSDGGIYVTHDRMDSWDHLNHIAIGQFYHVGVDPTRNYNVYGGLQDNGSWGGPNRSRHGEGPINEDWISIGGGDGFICLVDSDDPDLVYYASQNGGLGRYNLRTFQGGYMRPRAPRGTRYRFNWMTPYILSHHNPSIYYCAGNHVFRSPKHGEKLKAISPEISLTDEGSASALAECPHDPDVLYAGTVDGALWRTRNGGHEWDELSHFPDLREKDEEKEEKEKPKSVKDKITSVAKKAGAMLELMGKMGKRKGKAKKEALEEEAYEVEEIQQIEVDAEGEIVEVEQAVPPKREGESAQTESEAVEEVVQEEVLPPEEGQEKKSEEKAETLPEEEPVKESKKEAAPPQEDPISGEWKARVISEEVPTEESISTLNLIMTPDGKVTGTVKSPMGEGEIANGQFDREKKKLIFTIEATGMSLDADLVLKGSKLSGTLEMAGIFSMDYEAKRIKQAATGPAPRTKGDESKAEEKHEFKPLDQLVPGPRWVSCIEPSKHKEGRIYLALDGHRSNDDEPYLFVSEDHGDTWRPIRGNLPTAAGSTRVIREDLYGENMLYAGTEFAAWVSVDRGDTWTRLNNNLPTVAVHELAQHPTSGEIVAATHGRSLWILDVTALRQMNTETLAEKAYLYKPNTVVYWQSKRRRGRTNRRFVGENPPTAAQIYYSLAKKAGQVKLQVTDLKGEVIRDLDASAESGLHRVNWDMRKPAPEGRSSRYRRGPRVEPGKYLVKLTVGNQVLTQELKVEGDPEYPETRPWFQGPELDEEETNE